MQSIEPYTAEECRVQFFEQVRTIVNYWAKLPHDNLTVQQRCEGVAFSIMNIFDGTSVGLPAMDIRLAPHPDDRQYHINNGEKWYQEVMVINETMLHEEYADYR